MSNRKTYKFRPDMAKVQQVLSMSAHLIPTYHLTNRDVESLSINNRQIVLKRIERARQEFKRVVDNLEGLEIRYYCAVKRGQVRCRISSIMPRADLVTMLQRIALKEQRKAA